MHTPKQLKHVPGRKTAALKPGTSLASRVCLVHAAVLPRAWQLLGIHGFTLLVMPGAVVLGAGTDTMPTS